jgi:hypothetical protein
MAMDKQNSQMSLPQYTYGYVALLTLSCIGIGVLNYMANHGRRG